MACLENVMAVNDDSEMEEGEIVDDLSDISSEEEFLLRQRLEVLENYNNVLERKKAKRTFVGAGTKRKKEDTVLCDLSEISATELEDYCSVPHKKNRVQKYQKPHYKQRRKKEEVNKIVIRSKERSYKKKVSRPKKKIELKVIDESSEESEDEYRNKRKRLADAVVVNKTKNDKTSLSERLQKMLCGVNPEPMTVQLEESKKIENPPDNSLISPPPQSLDGIISTEIIQEELDAKTECEIIDICSDEDSNKPILSPVSIDPVNTVVKENTDDSDIKKILDRDKNFEKDSDDDLELLRQLALKTKTVKAQNVDNDDKTTEAKILSEDEDSDTAELRLICLKSSLLKKAIEMKRKQKLKKRLSQSSNLEEDSLSQFMLADKMNVDNNTDIESVDMDIGSDGEDKLKENDDSEGVKNEKPLISESSVKEVPVLMASSKDILEDDEDLLRANLLTSLTKKLPNLTKLSNVKTVVPKPSPPLEEKRFIISLVNSDSEGETESAKNLTKMHLKLSEKLVSQTKDLNAVQAIDSLPKLDVKNKEGISKKNTSNFQQELDMFLKSTRMEVEKKKLPDVVQQPTPSKNNEKFVAKAVKNLPKSEQIEYKKLVKRMAELEKIKEARQSSMDLKNLLLPVKDTLKPRNVTINPNLTANDHQSVEDKINSSRKNIAEESAKMLKLKDEETKLSQKFKIVATELRNIKTALALNKKQQLSVQNSLSKKRLHHQMLLKRSLSSIHSKTNSITNSKHVNTKLQKENNPKDQTNSLGPKDGYKNQAVLKTIKIGIINDIKQQNAEKIKTVQPPRLSIETDITNSKRVVSVSLNDENKDNKHINNKEISASSMQFKQNSNNYSEKKHGGFVEPEICKRRDGDDYKSPLDYASSNWEEDPNAILCRFDVGGDCKDADCKYLHTNTHTK